MCRIGKKLFFCVIVSMIVSVSVLAQQTQRPIRLGFDIDYPPFSFVDKAAPVGFDVDVVRELNQYSQQKIEIVLDTWSTVQADLNTGKLDAVGGILYTEERAKIYDFTIPYNYEPAVVFISKKTMANSIQDLQNKKLADIKGDPLYELAGIEFALAQKSGITFGLLMIDIEWFKNFNDKFGHDIGDQIILHLAQTFKTYFRVDDVICRFGGEEFIVLLPKTTEEMAKNIAERIRQLISEDEFNISDGRIVKYTLSIGVATFRMSDDDLDQIIKRADTALYEAKHEGRNRIVICPSAS